ncbi:hypothetical protein DRN87_04985 [Candidatus Geothermarchaeota archaeon]|nr:MAG: hypothetical protein DRN87_04985 [Candidatus Geothermarchaeota archaeon]
MGLIQVLKPNLHNIPLFILLAFISVGGVIQTYAFIDDADILPKPPLYDILKPFNLWFPWLYLTAPIQISSLILNLRWISGIFPELSPGFKLPLGSILYSYVTSAWSIYIYRRYISTNKRILKIFIIISIGFGCIFSPVISLPFITIDRELITFTLSGFLLITLITLIYLFSIYGLYKLLRNYLAEKPR